MKKLMTAALLLLVLAGSFPAQASEAFLRTDVATYKPGDPFPGIYVKQFQLTGEEFEVDVSITDDLGIAGPIRATIFFIPDCGDQIPCFSNGGPISFCGAIVDVAVPSGARWMQVGIAQVSHCSPPGVATSGTITAAFSKQVAD